MSIKINILIFYFIFSSFFIYKADAGNDVLVAEAIDTVVSNSENSLNSLYFLDCPADIEETVTDGCEKIVSWPEPTSSSNPDVTEISSIPASGSSFPLGETVVTLQGKNSDGQVIEECSFTVTVKLQVTENYVFPDSKCAYGDITKTVTQACNRAVTWLEPSVPCDEIQLLVDPFYVPGDEFPIGTTEVEYIAIYNNKILDRCSFTVTIIDDFPPVFDTCPTDITVNADENCEAIVTWDEPSVSDNCGSEPDLTSNFNSGSTFPLGTTTVTYTATDESGNIASCSFDVTVVDNTGPELINIPSDITVNVDENCEAAVSWDEITANDNCNGQVNIITNFNSGDLFPIGETTVDIIATDDESNESTSSFKITVQDNSAPIVSNCPSDITVSAKGNCKSLADWTPPVFTDNCDTELTITSSHDPRTQFSLGTTLVTYTATDNAGNETLCSFNVIVEDDNSPNFTTCVADILLSANDDCEKMAEWTTPEVTDNCDNDITLESDFNSGDVFPLGTTTVTYTATDDAGNTSNCSFNVIVEDNNAPVALSCPEKLTINANSNCIGIAEWEEPVFEDCSNLSISSNFQVGDELPIGVTIIEYTATDDNGLNSSCSFEVEVIDQTPPEVEDCPEDITISTSDNCEATVEWDEPTATDLCSSVVVNSNFESGSIFSVGTTTIEYEFTDKEGNLSYCTFDINVVDESKIIVNNCPDDIIVKAENSNGTANVSWETPTATAECSEITVNSNHNSGSSFEVGTTTVNYTFITENGQSESCSFEITVEPLILDIEINKLITPNGDSNNDTWQIYGIEQFPDNQVTIVDRWGAEIYSVKGYNNIDVVWKGENKSGEIVPRGTYYYFISVKNEQDLLERKGFIEILR
ncbi:HYR domain-containing protein [Marivirga tractuosa]|uniref:HYR domain-containing protein n=1 Tax=Marivirga tractuosa TaxID=1006 RepID=UPI0035D036FD